VKLSSVGRSGQFGWATAGREPMEINAFHLNIKFCKPYGDKMSNVKASGSMQMQKSKFHQNEQLKKTFISASSN
jgi:hypothetical protein